MGYHPRIETTNIVTFATTRSRNSEMWFINNRELEQAILGYLAKFQKRYNVTLYAFAIEGNHIHDTALFPEANRSHFMRDLNSCIARAVPRYTNGYPGGKFWGRRYSAEFVPAPEDVEKQFFYTVLQPVKDGIVDHISEYQGYNCFHDAVCGITRKFRIMNWSAYNEAKKRNASVSRLSFLEEFELKYDRLPGYEDLSSTEYKKLMYRKLQQHTKQAIKDRSHSAAGMAAARKKRPGSRPRRTKISHRYSPRPRILCHDMTKKNSFLRWYFSIYLRFRQASMVYRMGDLHADFPPGTYKPPVFTIKYKVPVLDMMV